MDAEVEETEKLRKEAEAKEDQEELEKMKREVNQTRNFQESETAVSGHERRRQ